MSALTIRSARPVLAAAVTAFFSDALVTPYFRQADNTGASEYFQRRRFTPRSPRRPAMTTSREYREFARECTKWAADAASAESRNSLLHLAADWIIASVITDRRELDARRQAVASSTRSPNRALTASETATWSPWRAA